MHHRGVENNTQFSDNKSPYVRTGARYDHSYYDRLIASRICAFDWYQNHRPWMTLNSRYALYCSKDTSFRTHCKNVNEDRPYYHRQKCRTMTLLSRNIRYMQISAGVPQGVVIKQVYGGEYVLFSSFMCRYLESSTRYNQSYY